MSAAGTAAGDGRTGRTVPPFARRTVSVHGAALRLVVGPRTGPSMLLVHGLAARWQVFAHLMTRWSPDWTVSAIDLPGHGGSARAPHLYSVRGYAAAVAGALDVLALDSGVPAPACTGRPAGSCRTDPPEGRAVVVGHSAGGWAAIQAAVLRPERVAALVLLDTPVDATGLDHLAAATEVATASLTLRRLSPALAEVDLQVLEALRAGDLVGDYLPRRLLPRLRCPVLLVQAEASRGGLMSDADVRTVQALVPDVRHVRVTTAGHALPVEAPDRLDEAVRDFLAQTPATYLPAPQRL